MKLMSRAAIVALSAGLAGWSPAFAQAPAGSTGTCKDGTYTSAEKKRGACAGHGGVKDWYATKKSEEKSAKGEGKSTDAKPAATSKASATPATKTAAGPRADVAPGGGAGKVWVNTSTHVYHCTGDKWYGKTKQGEYMSEADAKAKGAHADHGKACG